MTVPGGSSDASPFTVIAVGLTSVGVLGALPVAFFGPNVEPVTAGPGIEDAAPFVLNGQTGVWPTTHQPLTELTEATSGIAQPIGYPGFANGTLTILSELVPAEMASVYPLPAPPAVYGGPRRQFRHTRN